MEETLENCTKYLKGKFPGVKYPLDIKDEDTLYFIRYLVGVIQKSIVDNLETYEDFFNEDRTPSFFDTQFICKAYKLIGGLYTVLGINPRDINIYIGNVISNYLLDNSDYHTKPGFADKVYRLSNTILQKNGLYPLRGKIIMTEDFKNIYITEEVKSLLKVISYDIIANLLNIIDYNKKDINSGKIHDAFIKVNMVMVILNIKNTEILYG